MPGIHGMYVIQGIQADVLLLHEASCDDKLEALTLAISVLKDPTFKGEQVRVVTLDGLTVVWDSRADAGDPMLHRAALKV